MKRSLFSDRWYRVVDLHPRLPGGVRVDRQHVRGERWHVLSSGARGRSFRVNPAAWEFIGRVSPDRSVAQVWDDLLSQQPETCPTQDELIDLMTRLYAAGLLEFERSPDIELMLDQSRRQQRADRGSRMNPLSFRVSFGDPSALLDRIEFLARPLFGPAGLVGWLLLVLAGLSVVLGDVDRVLHHASQWIETPRYILIGWCCYPLIKVVHEAAHGLAVRRFDGAIAEAGVSLFCLLPMPYVDASDANRFPWRYQRALVSAAGILAELAVAAVGILVWSQTEPGLLNDLAFSFAFIGGVSTVVFNANPLMRLDGYHLLCDALSLPNLAARSAGWWKWWFVRYPLRVGDAEPPASAPGETGWLVAYAPAAWFYRVTVAVWLTLWGGSYHPALGLLVGLLAAGGMIVLPLARTLKDLAAQLPGGGGRRGPGRARLVAVVGAVLAVLVGLPLPDRTIAQGVVWLPEQAHVRPGVEGFVAALPGGGHDSVPGEPLVRLDDPALVVERERLVSRRDGLVTGLYQALATDTFKGKQVGEEIASIDEQIRLVDARLDDLIVTARAPGRLTVAREQDLPGRFFKQGETIGFLVGRERPVVRAVVAQEEAERLRAGIAAVSVRLGEHLARAQPARVLRLGPSAIDRLPSQALGDRAGGDIRIDPADKDGVRPLQPSYLVELAVDDLPADRTGGRVWVRFDLGRAPIALQAFRQLRQAVLTRFSPLES